MASHLASLWNRGLRQLRNGLLTITAKGAEKQLEKLKGDMKHMQRAGSVMGTLDKYISKNAEITSLNGPFTRPRLVQSSVAQNYLWGTILTWRRIINNRQFLFYFSIFISMKLTKR